MNEINPPLAAAQPRLTAPWQGAKDQPPVRVNRRAMAALKCRVTLPGYELTDHAADAIAERDIDITWVVRVLAKPDRTESDR